MPKNKASIEQYFIVLAFVIVLIAILWNGTNFLCQWNFYNTYIDNGLPMGLQGESFGDRLLLIAPSGSYSIRFISPNPPPFQKVPVKYCTMPSVSKGNALTADSFYSLEPQLWNVIPYLQRKYPADLSSLSDPHDLSYFHSGISEIHAVDIEHRYIIRNIRTNVNFFLIDQHYTGT